MMHRRLGTAGPEVSVIGLGCMGMSDLYGPADRGESIATIHAALDAGITLLDTGDFYGMGRNEMLIGEALAGRDRDGVVISVKFRRSPRCGRDLVGLRCAAYRGEELPWLFATEARRRLYRHLPPVAARSERPHLGRARCQTHRERPRGARKGVSARHSRWRALSSGGACLYGQRVERLILSSRARKGRTVLPTT
jgi:aldo/keto reductase family protein